MIIKQIMPTVLAQYHLVIFTATISGRYIVAKQPGYNMGKSILYVKFNIKHYVRKKSRQG